MGTIVRLLSVAFVVVLTVSSLHSGEEKDVRALIVKAIQAKGGEEIQAKYKGLVMKGTGTFYGLGDGIPFSGEWYYEGKAMRNRATIEIKNMNNVLTMVH